MIKISAVVITLNEERNIERCLLSLSKVADELLVVDSFSVDETENICRKFNAKFVQHQFEGYGPQKRYAVTQASYDFILSLDADEELSEELIQNILEIKQNSQHDVYSFNRLTNYCGKWIWHGGWYPETKIRLFDRRKTNWNQNLVHETVDFHRGLTKLHLKGNLHHYNYSSIEEHFEQMNNFSTLAAQEMFRNGVRTSILSGLMKAKWRFVREYFFKMGFLEGFYGFLIASISFFYTRMKYLKLYNLQVQQKNHATQAAPFPIDLVYLWCDGNDPEFIQKKATCLKNKGVQLTEQSVSDSRFLDNDELLYSLRSVEKYLPFVRYVYIVTDNQTPSWLNLSHPKIKLISHHQIIPEQYLPCFNSQVLESFLHKIPNLSEHFLYANDDMFFAKPLTPNFFFDKKGNPIVRVMKKHYPKTIEKLQQLSQASHESLYVQSLEYSNYLVAQAFGKISFYKPHHNADAYRKSYIQETITLFEPEFNKLYPCQFRQENMIQRIVFSFTDLLKNRASLRIVPRFKKTQFGIFPRFISNHFFKYDSIVFPINAALIKKGKLLDVIVEKAQRQHFAMFCLNDSEDALPTHRQAIKKALNKIYPKKSSFEKD